MRSMRIHIVGTSGSGKTTLARKVAGALEIPHVELDAIRHQANWIELPDDEFVARARDIAAVEADTVEFAHLYGYAPTGMRDGA